MFNPQDESFCPASPEHGIEDLGEEQGPEPQHRQMVTR